MVISRRAIDGLSALAVSMLLLLGSAAATAAPRFIAESQVRKGAVYTEVTIRFRCNIHYVDHDPAAKSDILRIRIEPTTVCTGAPPTVALTKELHRPLAAGDAWLDTIEYYGESPGNEHLLVSFTENLRFDVRTGESGNAITILVFPPVSELTATVPSVNPEERTVSRRILSKPGPEPKFVINLESSLRRPATADLPALDLPQDKSLFVAETRVDGVQWYRVQLGYFDSSEEAARALRELRKDYPGAWIGRAAEDQSSLTEFQPYVAGRTGHPAETEHTTTDSAASSDKVTQLMADARRAMTAGEISRAVQIYTKVLQLPPNGYQQEAQEYLALARERNGQIAHAKAEYERYLQVYPESDGAGRVRQRLSTLLATGSSAAKKTMSTNSVAPRKVRRKSPWTLRSFVSQYYRRDVNQVNDQDEIVNQSSIFTDVSLDARRRGARFDLATRITAGYRSDLLDETKNSDSRNDFRLSYAYVDVNDTQTGLRGRAGRQTRNTGGVLGRFDGLNLTYALTEKLRFEVVAGQPVYSTSTETRDSRTFQGVSTTFAPFSAALDIGAFYIEQEIEGLTDRSAVGAELRYFGERQSVWGIASYDTEFSELGSAFLQGSWRLPGNFTITGLVDVRRSPFLTLGNAQVGQRVDSFADLMVLFTEDELRQFALDRSPEVRTVSAGISRPLSPKLQFNFNSNFSTIDATPESGAVPATEQSEYSYYSADLVASSLFTEGDVGILGMRYAASDTTDVYSINLDTRFPIGRAWRINPRLRVDYREIRSDQSTQWIYSPALRVQYRRGRHWRIELQAGKRFSFRDMETSDLDRESNFVYFGYQFFY